MKTMRTMNTKGAGRTEMYVIHLTKQLMARNNSRVYLMHEGLVICDGEDDKGFFVACGPPVRHIWAIMMEDTDTKDGWVPYKMYTSNSHKIYKRAIAKTHELRLVHRPIRFKVEEVWESVPIEDMEKTYYETQEEVREIIYSRLGRSDTGLGRPRGIFTSGGGTNEEVLIEIEATNDSPT